MWIVLAPVLSHEDRPRQKVFGFILLFSVRHRKCKIDAINLLSGNRSFGFYHLLVPSGKFMLLVLSHSLKYLNRFNKSKIISGFFADLNKGEPITPKAVPRQASTRGFQYDLSD